MVLTQRVAAAAGVVCTLALACGGQKASPPPGQATEMKDSEVRTYIRGPLALYLDSLAYQVCILKYKVDPKGPGAELCIGPPDGYKPPPPDGSP
jgi:hypothetical protein